MNIKTFRSKAFTFALSAVLCGATLASCVEDNGNYDYKQLSDVTIEGIPQMTEVLAYLDHIKVKPVIKVDGREIKSSDAGYTVRYRLGYKGMGNFGYENGQSIVWKELTPEQGSFDLDIPADYNTGIYTLWVTVTDNSDGSVTSKQYDINVGSTTYEGWLVLCDEGDDNRVRLDMISKISSSRTEAIHDISAGLPDLHNATCITAFTQGADPGDQIHLLSREGAYNIDAETMECDPSFGEFNANYFAFDPEEQIIREDIFSAASYSWLQQYKVCFSENGNAYVMVDGANGSAYSTAVNTLEEGHDVAFKVAPFVGFNWIRPWAKGKAANMLFYDSTNRRFLLYIGGSDMSGQDKMQLSVISEPDEEQQKLFSYSTGKDMVWMQGTRRSSGAVYSVLQDPATGARSIYGINMGGTKPVQELYVENIDAPGFADAKYFAFDNRFPLLFYSDGHKLYCYNYAVKQTREIETGLAGTEEITMMKFNLYNVTDYTELIDQSDDFMNQQYRLTVATFDSATGLNGGKVTFYDVDGATGTATKAEAFSGFAKVRDICYRPRIQ